MTHFSFLGLNAAVRFLGGEPHIEKAEGGLEGCRAPTQAVSRRAAVKTMATTLYEGLATRFLCDEQCLQGGVCIDHMVLHTHTTA